MEYFVSPFSPLSPGHVSVYWKMDYSSNYGKVAEMEGDGELLQSRQVLTFMKFSSSLQLEMLLTHFCNVGIKGEIRGLGTVAQACNPSTFGRPRWVYHEVKRSRPSWSTW